MSVGVVDKTTGDPIPTAGMPYMANYSTAEQKTGQKWIDGRDIWFKMIVFDSTITINSNTWSAGIELTGDKLVDIKALNSVENNVFPVGGNIANNELSILNTRNSIIAIDTIIAYYTKKI